MITTQKNYLYGGTKSDNKKPERLLAKMQKANAKAKRFRTPNNFDYRSFCINGVRVESLEEKSKSHDKAIILLHGGAFLRGNDDFYRKHMLYFARKLKCKVFLPDYSLMPVNPYPKQIEELSILFDYVTQTTPPYNIVILGVGSGANLALLLSQTLSVQKMFTPRAQVLISPWLDMTASGDSYYDKFYLDKALGNYVVDGPDLPSEIKKTQPYKYIGNVANKSSWVSPLFGPMYGIPPTYICVGDYSILQSDAERLYQKLQKAGIESKYVCLDGQIGEYVLFYKTKRKAKKSMDKIIEWIRNALK